MILQASFDRSGIVTSRPLKNTAPDIHRWLTRLCPVQSQVAFGVGDMPASHPDERGAFFQQAAKDWLNSSIWRFLFETLGIALIYFVLARTGQTLAINPGNVTPIWPASGFALVIALRYGFRAVVGLWLGNFLANTWAFLDMSTTAQATRTILTGLAIGPGDVLQALLGAFLFRRCCHGGGKFTSVREVFCFVGMQSVACLSSATLGVLVLYVGGIIPQADCGYTWLTWYLGDGIGIITVGPLLLCCPPLSRVVRNWRKAIEVAMMLVAGALVSFVVFRTSIEIRLSSVAFAVVLWAAVRGHQFSVTMTVLVIAAPAIWGTSLGHGPFSSPDRNVALLSLQIYIATMLVTGLSMAAALDERERSAVTLRSEIKRRQVSEGELAVAAQIQQSLLPKRPPSISGLDIAGRCIAADSAAGDFYDFIPLRDGRLGVVIGDVSGHGVGPALIMAATRRGLRSLKNYHSDIGELLSAANADLCEDTNASKFITVFLAAIDAPKQQLQWSSAGHAALLLDPHGEFVCLPALSLPLGIAHDEKIPSSNCVRFEPGAILVLLTDGLTEARNSACELFGQGRLKEIVRSHRMESAHQIVDRLIEAVHQFCLPATPSDDVTLVIVRVI